MWGRTRARVGRCGVSDAGASSVAAPDTGLSEATGTRTGCWNRPSQVCRWRVGVGMIRAGPAPPNASHRPHACRMLTRPVA